MADTLLTLDLVQAVGQTLITHPSLFGATIVYLTRQGVGMIPNVGVTPLNEREYIFKNTGLFAYKIRFYSAAETSQNVHIIYKIV
jgi:hypothetical protein